MNDRAASSVRVRRSTLSQLSPLAEGIANPALSPVADLSPSDNTGAVPRRRRATITERLFSNESNTGYGSVADEGRGGGHETGRQRGDSTNSRRGSVVARIADVAGGRSRSGSKVGEDDHHDDEVDVVSCIPSAFSITHDAFRKEMTVTNDTRIFMIESVGSVGSKCGDYSPFTKYLICFLSLGFHETSSV